MTLPIPTTPLLTPADIRALPSGTEVLVQWSGGNGPWLYEITPKSYDGQPPFFIEAYSVHKNRPHGYPDQRIYVGTLLSWNHEEVWGQRMHDKVWLPQN